MKNNEDIVFEAHQHSAIFFKLLLPGMPESIAVTFDFDFVQDPGAVAEHPLCHPVSWCTSLTGSDQRRFSLEKNSFGDPVELWKRHRLFSEFDLSQLGVEDFVTVRLSRRGASSWDRYPGDVRILPDSSKVAIKTGIKPTGVSVEIGPANVIPTDERKSVKDRT